MRNRSQFAPIGALAAAMLVVAPAQARANDPETIPVDFFGGIDFGDDSGSFAADGECDDMRFTGEGMSETPLLAEDLYHDASDCRAAYRKGTIALNPLFLRLSGQVEIVWGDDMGEFARDGECDDLRFEGVGMTFTPLLAEDIGHDATDCRAAYKAGKVVWRSGAIGRLDAPGLIT